MIDRKLRRQAEDWRKAVFPWGTNVSESQLPARLLTVARAARWEILLAYQGTRDGTDERKFLFELLVPAEDTQLQSVDGDSDRYDSELRPELMRRAIAEIQDSGIEVVDPTPWLCYQGECPIVIGGTLSYRDTDHITTEYAANLWGELGSALHMLPVTTE